MLEESKTDINKLYNIINIKEICDKLKLVDYEGLINRLFYESELSDSEGDTLLNISKLCDNLIEYLEV